MTSYRDIHDIFVPFLFEFLDETFFYPLPLARQMADKSARVDKTRRSRHLADM